jgi:hypothetical protein
MNMAAHFLNIHIWTKRKRFYIKHWIFQFLLIWFLRLLPYYFYNLCESLLNKSCIRQNFYRYWRRSVNIKSYRTIFAWIVNIKLSKIVSLKFLKFEFFTRFNIHKMRANIYCRNESKMVCSAMVFITWKFWIRIFFSMRV